MARQFELELLQDLGERIRLLGGELSPTADWSYIRLREMNRNKKYIAEKLTEFTGMGIKEIEKTLSQSLTDTVRNDMILFNKADVTPIYTTNNNAFYKVLDNAKRIATSDFTNMSNTLFIDKTYNEILDYAHIRLSAGKSITTVVRDAAAKVRANGIHIIEYESGRRINVETAVRRNVMGALNRATDRMSLDNAEKLGTDDWEVSAHFNARPDHAIWQGKVYTMQQLIDICGYGTGDGLEGWNCRHQKFPFIKGLSERAWKDEELKHLHTPDVTYNGVTRTGYEATQYQRQIENRIRQLKREHAVSQDPATAKLIKQNTALYKDFSEKAGLKLQMERFNIFAKKVANSPASGIMKATDITVGKSVGAKAKNYDILAPNGDILHLSEGTRVTNINIIAGKGRDRQIDIVDILVDKYGGTADEWQKAKGLGYVDFEDESFKAELHWYQEDSAGKVEWKIKTQKGGAWYIDED